MTSDRHSAARCVATAIALLAARGCGVSEAPSGEAERERGGEGAPAPTSEANVAEPPVDVSPDERAPDERGEELEEHRSRCERAAPRDCQLPREIVTDQRSWVQRCRYRRDRCGERWTLELAGGPTMRVPQLVNGVALGTLGARGDRPAALVVRFDGGEGPGLLATGCPSGGGQHVEIVAPSPGGRWRRLLSVAEQGMALFVSEGDDRIALERERGPWSARACTAVELSWVEGRLVEGEPVECDPARRLRGDLSCHTEPAPTGGDPLEGIDGL